MANPTEKTLNALLSSSLRIEEIASKAQKGADENNKNTQGVLLSISSNIEVMKNSLEKIESNTARQIELLQSINGTLGEQASDTSGGGKIEVSSKGLFGLVMSALLFKLVGKETAKEFTNFVGDYIMVFVSVWEYIDELNAAGPALYSATKGLVKSIALLALATPLIALVMPFVPAIQAIAQALAEVNKVVGSEENMENAARARKSVSMQVATLALAGLALVGLGMLVMTYPTMILAGIGVILGLALVFSLIGLAGPIIEKGTDAVAGMGIAIGLFGLGFLVASLSFAGAAAMAPGGSMLGLIAMMVGSIVGLGLAFALAGSVALFILEGAIAVAFMGLALLPFSLGVLAFSAVTKDLKLEDIVKMGLMLGGLGAAFAGIGWAALFILPGVLAVGAMGLALYSITWGMEYYVKSEAFEKFDAKQFQKLLKDLGKGFAYLGEGSTEGTSALKLLTGIDFGKTPIERGIYAAAGIGKALSSIAQGVGAWADLQNIPKIKGYDKNGNPIFDESRTADVDTAIENVLTVFTGNGNIKKSILYPFIYLSKEADLSKSKSLLSLVFGADLGKSPFARGIKAAAGIGPVLTRIAEGMGSWVDLSNVPVIVGYDDKGNPKYGSESIDLMETVRNVHRVLDPKDKKYSVTKPFIDFSNMEGNTKGGSLISLITGADFGSTPFQRGVSTIGSMGKVLGVLAESFGTWANVDNILIITGYDNKTGRPIYDGTTVDIKEITGNITYVMTEVANTFTKLAGPTQEAGGVGGWLGFTKNGGATTIGRMVHAMEPVGDLLSSLAEGFTSWADVSNIKIIEEIRWDPKTRTNRNIYSKESVNIKEITGNITFVLEEIGKTLVKLGGPPEESSGMGGWFGMTKNPKATTMTRAARAMAPVGDMLSGLAEGFKTWVDIHNMLIVDSIVWDPKAGKNRTVYAKERIDVKEITKNIENALTMVGETLIKLGGPTEEASGIGGWFGMTKNPQVTTMTRAARAMAPVGDMLSGLAEGFKTWADIHNMLIVDSIVWDEKKGKNRTIYSKERIDVKQITANIETALTMVGETLIKLGGPTEEAGGLAGWIGMTKNTQATTMTRAARAMAPVGDMLSGLAEGFKTFAEIKNIKIIDTYRWDEKAQKNVPVYSKESVDITKIAENVKTALTTVGDALIEVGGPPEPAGGIAGWIGMTKNTKATTMTRAANAMAPVGDLLSGLAEGFKTFAEISNIKIIDTYRWDEKAQKNVPVYSKKSVNINKIADNVKTALVTVGDALVEVGGPTEPAGGLWGWLGATKSPKSSAITRAAKAMAPMGDLLGGLAEGFKTFAEIENIKVIDSYIWNEKAQKNVPVYSKKSVSINKIAGNIKVALTTVADAMEDVAGRPVQKSAGLFGWKKYTVYPKTGAISRAAKSLAPMGEMLGGFAEGMKTFANINNILQIVGYKENPKTGINQPIYSDKPVNITTVAKNAAKAINLIADALVSVAGKPKVTKKKKGGLAGLLGGTTSVTSYPRASAIRRAGEALLPMSEMLANFAEGMKAFANIDNIPLVESYKYSEQAGKMIPVYGKTRVNISQIGKNIGSAIGSIADVLSQFNWYENFKMKQTLDSIATMPKFLSEFADGLMPWATAGAMKPITHWKTDKVLKRRVPVYAKEPVSIVTIVGNVKFALESLLQTFGQYTGAEVERIKGAVDVTDGIGDVLGDLLEGIMTFARFDKLRPVIGKRKKKYSYKFWGKTFYRYKWVKVYGRPVSGKKIISNIKLALTSTLGVLAKIGGRAKGLGFSRVKTGVFAFEHMAKYLYTLAKVATPFEKFSNSFFKFSVSMGIFAKNFKLMDVEGINAFRIWTEKLATLIEVGGKSKSMLERGLDVATDVINTGFNSGEKLNNVTVEKTDTQKQEIIDEANEAETPEKQMMLQMTAALQGLQGELSEIKSILGGELRTNVTNMPEENGFPL